MYISIYLYNNTSAWCCKCNERKTHFHVMTKQLPFSGLINKTNDPIDPVTYLIFIYCWVGESHCRKIDEDWISIKAIHTFIGVFIYTASHDNMPWNRRFQLVISAIEQYRRLTSRLTGDNLLFLSSPAQRCSFFIYNDG